MLPTMPPLAVAKACVGETSGSSTTKSEGRQNVLCVYLSSAPLAALLVAGVAVEEGREA